MSSDSYFFSSEQERLRLQHALRESEVLRELTELLASSLDLTHILQVLVKRTTEVCEVERCAVWLFEESRNLFVPKTYFLSTQQLAKQYIKAGDNAWYRSSLSLHNPFIQQLMTKNECRLCEDLQTEPGMKSFAEKFLVRSSLFVALRREGRIVGILSLDNPGQPLTFSSAQQQLVCAIGQQAAVAIDNARLYQHAQNENKRAERLIKRAQSIYEVALAVNSHEDLSTVLGIATQHLVSGLDADGGSIFLLDNGALLLASTTQQHFPMATLSPALDDLPHCLAALEEEAPLFFTQEQITDIEKGWYQQIGLTHVLIVPLIVGARNESKQKKNVVLLVEKRCVGFAFVNYARTLRQPSKGHRAFALDIAAQCALAIEKNQLLASANQAVIQATEQANTLSAVFNAMTEGVMVLDQEGQIIVNNQTAAHFLGMPLYTKEHLTAFLQHYPIYTQYGSPIDYKDFPFTRALHGENIRGERFITRRADNSERTVELSSAPLHDSESRRIGVVCAFRDVTEQVRVEQRIRQALDVMLNAAEVLSGVTDTKEILRLILTMTLHAVGCERGFVHLFDAERELFIPLLAVGFANDANSFWNKEQQYWFAPNTPHAHEPYASLISGHATLIPPEYRISQEDTEHSDTVLVAPLTHGPKLFGLMVLDRAISKKEDGETFLPPHKQYARREFSVWDVTVVEGIAQFAGLAIEQAHWQAEVAIARTNEAEMRASNALKEEFLSITAHEFRSPLTIILANSQLVERTMRRIPEMPKRDRLQECITSIEEQTHQLTNIVSTFLEVSRINKGQIVLNLEKIDIGELLRQEVNSHSAVTTMHDLHYIADEGETPYYVMGDSARLQQIFGNLLQNAIKYSPYGGPITVLTTQRIDDQGKAALEIRIADKGIGIPADALPHLFERFYRAPNVDGSKTKGVGLGLYIVAEFIRLQNGTIRAESSGEYGEGSCFIVTFPLLESCEPSGE